MIRVLLVDDEADYRESLARRLGRRQMYIFQAGDGASCLDALSREEAHVVVLDMKMPGLSGMETLSRIRAEFAGVQVIFLTGNSDVCAGVEGIKAGAFDYLVKPVKIEHLAGKIRQARQMQELKASQEKERAFRARLERRMMHTQRLASLGTMSTGIAHEINNPLAVIKESAGFIRGVLEDAGNFAEKDLLFKGLEKIETSIDRARRITHQLLGYVKKQGSEVSHVDLGILVEETLELVRSHMAEKTIRVETALDPSARYVSTDPFQVRQVLINLLENAVDAVPSGGRIKISTLSRKGWICLAVADEGEGMPPEYLEKIFDPFFTTKSGEKGTGLGLFVVHRIIENIHGTIDVTSTLGKGSCFTVCLPETFETDIPQGQEDNLKAQGEKHD